MPEASEATLGHRTGDIPDADLAMTTVEGGEVLSNKRLLLVALYAKFFFSCEVFSDLTPFIFIHHIRIDFQVN